MALGKNIGESVTISFPRLETLERVVLLIDVSRSMSQSDYPPRRLDAARQAALGFVDKKLGIDDHDEIVVVAFARGARTVVGPLRVGDNRKLIQRKLMGLKISYGGTRLGKGLERARALLASGVAAKGSKWKGVKGNKDEHFLPRIILLSDGENLGGADPVLIAAQMKKSGVFIDAIGIGERGKGPSRGFGLDEKVLGAIASPGRYRYIGDGDTLLFHFEGLAEKVVDASTGYATRMPDVDDVQPVAQVTLMPASRGQDIVQHPHHLIRKGVVGLICGLITAAVIGAYPLPQVLGPIEGSWVPAWGGAGITGLLVAWLSRIGLRDAPGLLAVVVALCSALASLGLALYMREPAVAALLAAITDAPVQYGIVCGLVVAGVILGQLWKPAHFVSAMRVLTWSVLKWRSPLTKLKATSPFLGQVCLNEKDQASRFRVGDWVVVCPQCGRPHHVDCWAWNNNGCFGGDTPCSGTYKIPYMARARSIH